MENKTNINWYPGHMAKAKRQIKEKIDLIDIVLEVIDARIPKSSKIIDIDEFTKGKPRILILSKYDLCDKIETNKWIKYYEDKGYIVIPCNITSDSLDKIIFEITKQMDILNEKRIKKGMKTRKARVLVLGIPNVGKSTLINRLVGKKVVQVGNKPGVTKDLNWIRVSNAFELLDSPGILWPKFEGDAGLNLASLTAIKEDILPEDQVGIYILNMLNKYYPDILETRYQVNDIEDIIESLDIIGKKRGCLMRGGEVDYDKVYKLLLQEIKDGTIKNITFDRFE